MSKLKEKAEAYLKANPGAEVHGTQDGFLFHKKQDAQAHARTLKNKEVTSFGVKDLPVEVEAVEDVSGMQGNEETSKVIPIKKKPTKKTSKKAPQKDAPEDPKSEDKDPSKEAEKEQPGQDGAEQPDPEKEETKA